MEEPYKKVVLDLLNKLLEAPFNKNVENDIWYLLSFPVQIYEDTSYFLIRISFCVPAGLCTKWDVGELTFDKSWFPNLTGLNLILKLLLGSM